MTDREELEAKLRAFVADEDGEEIIQSLAALAGHDEGEDINVKLGIGSNGFYAEIAGTRFNVKLTVSPKE